MADDELPPGFWADESGVHHDHDHDSGIDDFDLIKSRIDEDGFQCIQVLTTADDPPDAEDFSYTIGLRYSFDDHPDLLVVGLGRAEAYATIKGVVGLIREGRRFDDGDEADVAGLPVRFVELDDEDRLEHLAMTDRFYARSPFRALRIVAG
jgi:hypothetical protein